MSKKDGEFYNRMTEHIKTPTDALNSILKWEYATDGRKFNGDYKELLKLIIHQAKKGLNPKQKS